MIQNILITGASIVICSFVIGYFINQVCHNQIVDERLAEIEDRLEELEAIYLPDNTTDS